MTLSATVDTLAGDIVATALKPPKERAHCIYCSILVREVVWLKEQDELEYERCVVTDDGLVCEECEADPLAKARWEMGKIRQHRHHIAGYQVRSIIRRQINPSKQARNDLIMELRAKGWTYARIGMKVGLSKNGAQSVAYKEKKRLAALDTAGVTVV